MRLAIIGSRDYPSKARVEIYIRYIARYDSTIKIVSGAGRGVDTWAIQEAKIQKLDYLEFPANWTKYGKSAGFKRNVDIITNCDCVLAFIRDDGTTGTCHSLTIALQQNKSAFTIDEFGNKHSLLSWGQCELFIHFNKLFDKMY